ncbi:tetratricopeptide repeat protein [Streptomyces sp. 4F14]|uniref:tetratricopeptide repeat protein n=1 Tax=Streptomyces sp. 4F14 TaxID=3394380 RepID=UPI003A8A94C2
MTVGGDHLDFGGAEFHGIVVAKGEVHQHAVLPEALDGLPARTPGFTGRDAELAALLSVLEPASRIPAAAVSGLGGAGKTALTVEAAHEACARGWFPGGVLFLDLHGYDDESVSGALALAALLRAMGTRPEDIPARADERASLYRSLLVRRGRERGAVLVLADNASSPDQVRPLLPGDARHRLLVTSRTVIPQLGARLVVLGELSAEESRVLLDRVLRVADPGDERVAAEPRQAAMLAELCGSLPLALQIAAALLAVERGRSVGEFVVEFGGARDRLERFDDGERSVRAAFDLSYRQLSSGQAQLLRLLAVAPGVEVGDEVVAVLAGAAEPPVRDLGVLTRAHLVARARGRWRMHDLVRAYGLGMAGEAEEAARGRVLRHYGERAEVAAEWLRWLPGAPEPGGFGSLAEALAWLDAEREGLVAATAWVPHEDAVARLAAYLADYLSSRRCFEDGITVGRAELAAVRRLGDRRREARAWSHLGGALRQFGRTEEAITAHREARGLCSVLGDLPGEAHEWDRLGLALRESGRAGEAVEAHTVARDMFDAAGDAHQAAHAGDCLGRALREVGRVEEAITAHRGALEVFVALGDRHREARSRDNLGLALRDAGRVGEAVEGYRRAAGIYEELEDWFCLERSLRYLAEGCGELGWREEARGYARRAEELGSQG